MRYFVFCNRAVVRKYRSNDFLCQIRSPKQPSKKLVSHFSAIEICRTVSASPGSSFRRVMRHSTMATTTKQLGTSSLKLPSQFLLDKGIMGGEETVASKSRKISGNHRLMFIVPSLPCRQLSGREKQDVHPQPLLRIGCQYEDSLAL